MFVKPPPLTPDPSRPDSLSPPLARVAHPTPDLMQTSAAVVDLYYGSRDVAQTLNQCQKDVEQVVSNEHTAAFEAAVAAAATPAMAAHAPSSAVPPRGSVPEKGATDWVRYTSAEPGSIGRTYWHNTKYGRTVSMRFFWLQIVCGTSGGRSGLCWRGETLPGERSSS